jgi:hypothetical protein
MVSFTLTYDKDVLDALKADIARAPKTIAIFAEKTLPTLIRKDLTPLVTEPRNPDLPFVWSNDPVKQARARRWYFANKVKGRGGGRYVRTHALVNNWRVTAGGSATGSIVTVSNDTPGLEYVQGNRQVPSHKDSGWAQYDDVLLKAEKKANDLLIEAWFNVLVAPAAGSKFK